MSTPHAFDYDTVYSRKVRVGIPRSPRVVVPYDFAVGHPDAGGKPCPVRKRDPFIFYDGKSSFAWHGSE